MTDNQLKQHCVLIGGLIPKLSKIYDGVVPFHEQIELFIKKLNDLVVDQDATTKPLFVKNLAMDDTKNPLTNRFEIELKWEVK